MIVNEHDPINKVAWDMPYDRYGTTISFVKFAEGTDPQVIYDKVEQVCKEIYPDMYGQAFFERLDMTRFDQLFFKDFGGANKQLKHGDLKTLKMLAIVGLLLLLSAVFNYINLSFALAGKRAKEMATRRLLGAQKGEIVWKYIAESLVFTVVCFGLGLLLAYLFAPSVNALLNNPDIPIQVQMKPSYILAYLAVIVVVGVLNGIIPALYASRVRKVFGGTVGSETWRTVKEYMILVAVACVIGVPIAVWAARRYLEGFIVKLENYGWVFVLAVIISLLMAFGSVLWQTLRAARTNPVDVLQKE